MQKPLTGVVPLYDENKESYWMLPGYMQALEEAGAVPFMLPLTDDDGIIKILAAKMDGFLFTGGQDADTSLYGEVNAGLSGVPCKKRDIMEQKLFKLLLEADKPVFGICRGIQIINVLLGGTLWQDIPAQTDSKINHKQEPPYDRPVHNVTIEPDSQLYQILCKTEIAVNSYHHQAVKTIAPGLKRAAYSEDGITEAAYMPDKKFVLAVQWHPEFSFQNDENSKRLFSAFAKSCKK